jgi:hypothetical protein
VHHERTFEPLEHFRRDYRCIVRIAQSRKHDGEFIAAQAAHSIFSPHAFDQTKRYLAKQRIAHTVSHSVIDALEPIEIDEHHAERTTTACRLCNSVSQTLVKNSAIRQIRKLIEMRKMRETFPRCTRFGNVRDNSGNAA